MPRPFTARPKRETGGDVMRQVIAACKEKDCPMPIRLHLPCQPPTLNELMRGHIRTRIKLGKAFRAVVAAHWRGPKATGKRAVTIKIILGPRQRGADPDAYFKAVGDSLVKCGALKDDTRHGVVWMPVEYEKGETRATVIELHDVA